MPGDHTAMKNLSETETVEHFVDAAAIAAFLHCSRKHVLRLSALGIIPAHPLPGSSHRKTWRYLLSEVREAMLGNGSANAVGRSHPNAVTSAAGSPRKGGR
jgi:hypothetical protein